MKVKICGLTRPEDIMAVNRFLPDYAGFVFAPGKRLITHKTAGELKALLSPEIQAVGVFVNAPLEDVLALSDSATIDLIQLHGDETQSYAENLRKYTRLPVIRAVRVKNTEDILRAQSFPADYLLLDTYRKGVYGGSGQCFDWSLIPELSKPYFLAGGVDFDNLKAAGNTGAFCLDVSSSVETDGKKDAGKIRDIVGQIRSL